MKYPLVLGTLLVIVLAGPAFAQSSSERETTVRAVSRADVKAQIGIAERARLLPMNDPAYPSAILAAQEGGDASIVTSHSGVARGK
jgi:hypothetical protein